MSEVPGPGSYSVLPALGLNTSRAASGRSFGKQVGISVRVKRFRARKQRKKEQPIATQHKMLSNRDFANHSGLFIGAAYAFNSSCSVRLPASLLCCLLSCCVHRVNNLLTLKQGVQIEPMQEPPQDCVVKCLPT